MGRFDGEPYIPPAYSDVYRFHNNKIIDSVYLDGVIYKITSPTGKIYIGQSFNVDLRIAHYKNLAGQSKHTINQFGIYYSVKKHGWSNHEFEIIDICKKEKASELEMYWISYYNTYRTPHGLNLTRGGSGVPVKTKTGSKHKTKKTPEHRKKISDFRKGKKQHKNTIDANSTPIYCFTTKEHFKSINDAARKLRIPKYNIDNFLQKKVSYSRSGYSFKHVKIEDYLN